MLPSTACLDSPESLAPLREDISHAASLDISGTPRTYVNGRMFKGAVSEAMLEAAIKMELGEAEVTEDGRVRTTDQVVAEEPLPDGPVPMVQVTHRVWPGSSGSPSDTTSRPR